MTTISRSLKALSATATAFAAAVAAAGFVIPSNAVAGESAAPARAAEAAASDGPAATEGSVVLDGPVAAPNVTVDFGTAELEAPDVEQLQVMHRNDISLTPGGAAWQSMYDLLEFTLQDADAYWTEVFASAGLTTPYVNYIFPMPGEAYTTACADRLTTDQDAFYCVTDDTILISQQLVTTVWDGTFVGPDGQNVPEGTGDFAVAVVAAHEYAHNLQWEIGLQTAGFATPQLEQHADCWAGVWARSAEQRGLLDPGDIEEGLLAAMLVGDSDVADPDHHGTPNERAAAFLLGYQSGAPADCDAELVG